MTDVLSFSIYFIGYWNYRSCFWLFSSSRYYMIKSDRVDGNIVVGLFQVVYKSNLPGQPFNCRLMTFRVTCFDEESAVSAFKQFYWKHVEKERLLSPSLLEVSYIDVSFYSGKKFLEGFTLYNSLWGDDSHGLKDFLSHPDQTYYQQLSLFDDPYWRYVK